MAYHRGLGDVAVLEYYENLFCVLYDGIVGISPQVPFENPGDIFENDLHLRRIYLDKGLCRNKNDRGPAACFERRCDCVIDAFSEDIFGAEARYGEGYLHSVAGVGLSPDFTIVQIDEALAYSQAQAGAFLSGTDLSVKLRELFKQSGNIVLRNAATRVFDEDEDVIVMVFTADVYGAALRRELETVRKKICDNFFYSVGIGVQNNRMGGN